MFFSVSDRLRLFSNGIIAMFSKEHLQLKWFAETLFELIVFNQFIKMNKDVDLDRIQVHALLMT